MPPSRRWTDDSGSASLEFITAGLVLLVPLVYLVLAMSAIQAGALAIEGAARQAARVFVEAPDEAAGEAAAIRALEFALADHGMAAADAAIAIECSADPCHTRRELVSVRIDVAVPLPLVPPVLQGAFPVAVPLSAEATQQVSRFWGGR
jgi:hypothetical protein